MSDDTTRRDVLRGGALGVGALVGAMGAANTPAAASTPTVRLGAAASGTQLFFLNADGITGPVTRKGFEKQIELLSFSWGLTNPSLPGSGGGGGAGKVIIEPLSIAMVSSLATPQLAAHCANGKHLKSTVLNGYRPDAKGAQTKYLTIKLTDVLVTSVQMSEGGGNAPTVGIVLDFAKIDYTEDGQTLHLERSAGN